MNSTPPPSSPGVSSSLPVATATAPSVIASVPMTPTPIALPGTSVVATPQTSSLSTNPLPTHNGLYPTNTQAQLQINTQPKRPPEDVSTPSAKRPRTDGATTPGLMGPPSAMGPPGMQQKKKDEGLDEGDPNDVFGGAGINLQDEERNMTSFDFARNTPMNMQQQYQQQQQVGDRARKSELLHYQAFEHLVNRKLSESGLLKFDTEIYALIGLAVKDRLSGLLGQMIVLAKHRCAPPPSNAKPIDDVGKILRGISLVEAQDEERRRTIAAARRLEEEAKRREAEDASTASKKKPGAAKNLTEQAIARNANATAQMMLNQSGGKKYSWMTGSSGTASLPRRNAVQAANGIQPNVYKTGSEEHGNLITLKDFIGAIEFEGEDTVGRGGKALLKAYTMLKD